MALPLILDEIMWLLIAKLRSPLTTLIYGADFYGGVFKAAAERRWPLTEGDH